MQYQIIVKMYNEANTFGLIKTDIVGKEGQYSNKS